MQPNRNIFYSPTKRKQLQPKMMQIYYTLKPVIPRKVQLFLRTMRASRIRKAQNSCWPISEQSAMVPEGWKGWKDGKQFALLLTHDIDSPRGYRYHQNLVEIEQNKDFVSAFYFVPEERYKISSNDLDKIWNSGFEVGVHGFNHDGKLLQSEKTFLHRAQQINEYIEKWNAVGFRAPAMHHDLNLFRHLNIQYDASTFDVDPFEPMDEGANTIFPFKVINGDGKRQYWEFPYTLPQDFTLFVILKEASIDIWKKKIDWVVQNGGMVHLDTHPDYMNFGDTPLVDETYPLAYYTEVLDYIRNEYCGKYWNPLPMQLVDFLNQTYDL